MQIKTQQYIYPPRPSEAIPREETAFLGEANWIAQLKYNDTRCLIKILPGGQIELWNRHAERLRSYHCPDSLREEITVLANTLHLDLDKLQLLDGGLLDNKHPLINDTIALWDVLVKDGEHLLGTTYAYRYDFLRGNVTGPWTHNVPTIGSVEFGLQLTPHILIPETYQPQDWPTLWDRVHQVNAPYTTGKPGAKNYKIKPILEGLVLKNRQGILELGYKEKNNGNWQMRSRITTGRHQF
jgi:hypothetical protein